MGTTLYRPGGPNSRDNGRFVSTAAEADRFWSKVVLGPRCWIWRGLHSADGYGRFFLTGGRDTRAHRYAYELLTGPIPEGLTLDHLCGRTGCVRPSHLEPVTNAENLRRRHARRRAQNGVTTP